MKFGILFRIQDPPKGEHIGRRMRETIRASQIAEEAGFDGVFLPEHHMMDDGYLPNPFPLLGALAAVTERIHIGTTIHLLPFYNPVQTAEASAVVDQISGGRLRLGVGIGNFEPEFELMGLEKKGPGWSIHRGHRTGQGSMDRRVIRLPGKVFPRKGKDHATANKRKAVDWRHVRSRCQEGRPLRLPVAYRSIAQHRGAQALGGGLSGCCG